jgi:hypothetical protein
VERARRASAKGAGSSGRISHPASRARSRGLRLEEGGYTITPENADSSLSPLARERAWLPSSSIPQGRTSRTWGVSMKRRITEINRVTVGVDGSLRVGRHAHAVHRARRCGTSSHMIDQAADPADSVSLQHLAAFLYPRGHTIGSAADAGNVHHPAPALCVKPNGRSLRLRARLALR